MATTSFDSEACHRAYREKVASLYGDSPKTGRVDPRQLFYLELLHGIGLLTFGKKLVDLGAGTSAFGPVASAMGMSVCIVDDFGGGGGVNESNRSQVSELISAWKSKLGMTVIQSDFLANRLTLESESVDVITSINSLEHWHQSPKKLFREINRVLKPDGHLILVTPNAANLRKRISALAGGNIWDRLEWWYDDTDPIFRGHVREPIIADLKQIMAWNDFEVVQVHGRNFLAQQSKSFSFLPKPVLKHLVSGVDWMLRLRPTLCSDIHVIGRKR